MTAPKHATERTTYGWLLLSIPAFLAGLAFGALVLS